MTKVKNITACVLVILLTFTSIVPAAQAKCAMMQDEQMSEMTMPCHDAPANDQGCKDCGCPDGLVLGTLTAPTLNSYFTLVDRVEYSAALESRINNSALPFIHPPKIIS